MSSSELGERVVARIIIERSYERMLERLRIKLDECRARTAEGLQRMGAKIAGPPPGGMYLWADFGRDTNELADGRQPRRRVVRAGQPVLADAVAEHLDAGGGGHLPQRHRDGVPAARDAALIDVPTSA